MKVEWLAKGLLHVLWAPLSSPNVGAWPVYFNGCCLCIIPDYVDMSSAEVQFSWVCIQHSTCLHLETAQHQKGWRNGSLLLPGSKGKPTLPVYLPTPSLKTLGAKARSMNLQKGQSLHAQAMEWVLLMALDLLTAGLMVQNSGFAGHQNSNPSS